MNKAAVKTALYNFTAMYDLDATPGKLNPSALTEVQSNIALAQSRSVVAAEHLTIIAVTKSFPPAILDSAYAGGLTTMGESRVQEAETKFPSFQHRGECTMHLIGHLQKNKVRKAVELFDVIESVDSIGLLKRLDRIAGEIGKQMPVYLQVNTGDDEAKFGFSTDELLKAIPEVIGVQNLVVAGVMTIAPYTDDETKLRSIFQRTREIRDQIREQIPTCTDLSMGMTGDYVVAVEEGATHIRIGRKLFGERPLY